MVKLGMTRRRLFRGALGAAGAALSCSTLGRAAWAASPFAPPPLEHPSPGLPGPGGLTSRDLLNRGYWPVPALPPGSWLGLLGGAHVCLRTDTLEQ